MGGEDHFQNILLGDEGIIVFGKRGKRFQAHSNFRVFERVKTKDLMIHRLILHVSLLIK